MIVLLLAWFGADGVQAAGPVAPKRPHSSALPDTVRRAERQTGGAVLSAQPMQRDGREVFRLKVLTADGRVKVMQSDPQQGQKEKKTSEPSSSSPVSGTDGDPLQP
jgi:hypothetical protein